MKKIKASVLVVDDQEDMLFLCMTTLREICEEVEGASSSAAAREAFHRRTFDLLLTDINIDADGDGVGLAAEIKNLSPSTMVIIMTADPTLRTAIGGLKTGASEYLIKPFPKKYLESVVLNAFEKSRLFSELEREKALGLELQAAYSQLKDSESVKNAFLGRLNHELRTPLAIAMASVELLGREIGGGKAREVWSRSESALRNLKLVIEELLLFSGLLKGSLKLKKEPLDLRLVLKEAAISMAFLYESMEVKVSVSLAGEPYQVLADAEMLSAVFKQLISNAVKFNSRGGSVSIITSYLEDRVVVSFNDTGCGVSPEAMPRIFDGFFQAADYLTRGVGGIGLGLATVKHIIEGHGGVVSARKNRDGPGMTFSVSLPRSAGH